MTPAQRQDRAFKIGEGIAAKVSVMDPSAMTFVEQIIYRQVDAPTEALEDSIKWCRNNMVDVRGEKIEQHTEADCTGPVPVWSLDDADKMFLWRRLREPGKAEWPYEVLAGTRAQVREAMSWADASYGGAASALQFDMDSYNGKLRQYV